MSLLEADANNIQTASRIVKNGGVLIYPTDTVYGLGCDPFNVEAVKRVFKVKGDRNKPLPILGSNLGSIQKIAHLSTYAQKIAEEFWPGPITLIVPKKPVLPPIVTRHLASVGVRIPRHEVALRLIELCGGLLVGTSANKTGQESARNAEEAAMQLRNDVDLILDGGVTPLGQGSSILDLTKDNPKMLREGPIKMAEIVEALKAQSSNH